MKELIKEQPISSLVTDLSSNQPFLSINKLSLLLHRDYSLINMFIFCLFRVSFFPSDQSEMSEYIFSFSRIEERNIRRIFYFFTLFLFHTIFKKYRRKKLLSRMYSPSHCRNKNMGCMDIEIVGTRSHTILESYSKDKIEIHSVLESKKRKIWKMAFLGCDLN